MALDIRPTEHGLGSDGSPFDLAVFMARVRPKWQQHAACKGHPPEWWHPEANDDAARDRAKQICYRCAVRSECLNHSMENPEAGIWGGLTEKERKDLRKALRRNPWLEMGDVG